MNNERKQTVTGSISACPLWSTQATEKVGKMIGQIDQANALLLKASLTGQSRAIKGGFAAETYHAESFNLDAILKDENICAFTDEFANTPLARNDPVNDIVIMQDGKQVLGAQSKYFQNADETQKAFRSTKDGVHRYEKSDVFLGPADQIDDIKASAHRAALKNQDTRPEVSAAAKKVGDNTTGSLEVGDVRSRPLSKRDAEQLGSGSKEGKELHEKMQTGYLNDATIQQSLRAARSAAMITAVTAGCINSFQYIKQVKNGEITAQQATQLILQDTVIAAGDSALKAGAATASASMAARSLPRLFAGTAFKRSLANGAIAGAAICVVDAVQCIVLFSLGKMTLEELETRTGKNIFQTGAGVVGGSIGMAIGALAGPPGALIGSLVGGMITTMAMNIALDNHVEKSFKLTLDSTRQVVSNGMAMHDALNYLHVSQEYYADFHQGLYLSEQHFGHQVKTMQAQSVRLKNKINDL